MQSKKKIFILFLSIASMLSISIISINFFIASKGDENGIKTITMHSNASYTRELTINDLVSDAELIVYGSVLTVTPYIEKDGIFGGSVSSLVDFKIDGILKGEVDGKIITVLSQGGTISNYEYFLANEDHLSQKYTQKSFEVEKMSALELKDSLYVEHVFDGAENVKTSDSLLLFLSYNEKQQYYYMPATSRFGKLNYNSEDEKLLRKINGELEIEVGLKDLLYAIENTADNSKNLKEARQRYENGGLSQIEMAFDEMLEDRNITIEDILSGNYILEENWIDQYSKTVNNK